MKYTLRIKPAIIPSERHEISKVLRKLGYYISGGGTNKDMSICDIGFESADLTEHAKMKADEALDEKQTRNTG